LRRESVAGHLLAARWHGRSGEGGKVVLGPEYGMAHGIVIGPVVGVVTPAIPGSIAFRTRAIQVMTPLR
jgi:hypothetical protein